MDEEKEVKVGKWKVRTFDDFLHITREDGTKITLYSTGKISVTTPYLDGEENTYINRLVKM